MKRFAAAAETVAATPSKRAKIAALATYFRTLDDDDLVAAARFFAGDPLAGSATRALEVGSKTLVAAASEVWGATLEAVRASYRASGDLATALAASLRPALDLGLFREPLTPARFSALLERLAAASGDGAAKRRVYLCGLILASCDDEREARYALKVLTGELRVGLRAGLVADAIAEAFAADPARVRAGLTTVADAGTVALAARRRNLEGLAVAYGRPLAFMLASPMAFGSGYRELRAGSWYVEDKFDGIRAQAHVRDGDVALFSRTHIDITAAFPDVAATLRAVAGDAIVDGEIVAERDGRVLPFRNLQARLGRVEPSAELMRDVPATFVAFDLLARGGRSFVDEPFERRRAELASVVPAGANARLAPATALPLAAGADAVERAFAESRARGNEGLVLKRADAPYTPGRRGKSWLKLKRELDTLDVVVVAVEWGHGKRARVLSDYTFAVRADDDSDRLLTLGKAYTGLTDAEIARMTPWFLDHATGESNGRTIAVSPQIVLEVSFDIVAPSALHESGYALRFPRIVRVRDDKTAADIDTLARVEAIYASMLARERPAGAG